MLTMSQINHIKDLSNCGYRISEISEKTGADPKTIRKYLSQNDFSPKPPIMEEKPSKLDPFKPIIQEWLGEDKKRWRKQHHTAQRVYERLVEEHGYIGSYSVVQRYMKKCRSYHGEMGKAVPNLLARDFHEERPIQLWVTGVTAFSLHGSKPSPSPGLDLYNGEVIRYAIGERTNYRQVEEVLAKAFADPRMAAG